MIKIVGVRFRNAGKIYYFGPGNLDLTAGMHVIVETARGVELGTVMIPTREVNDDSVSIQHYSPSSFTLSLKWERPDGLPRILCHQV